jgi:transaldolase
MGEAGLEAISRLASENIRTNCTLVFSANQGLLAAQAAASLISPFVGRLDDINEDGMAVVRDLVAIFSLHHLEAQVLAASLRHPLHVTQAALAGAHIATLPFKGTETNGAPSADRKRDCDVPARLGGCTEGREQRALTAVLKR